jgi:multidrug efflux pump subunit AcrA (membrane-fusion protein)
MSPVITSIFLAAAAAGQFDSGTSDPNVIENCYLYAIWSNDVPAKEAGVITELNIEEGATVKTDQLIAQIDDRDAVMAANVAAEKWRAAKVQAESDVSVRAAQKQEQLYGIELQRKLEVNKRVPNAVSETEIREYQYRRDRSTLEIEASQHQLTVAEADAAAALAEVRRAKMMIENREIKSPVNGFVSQILRRRGTWVAPGDPVASLVQMDRLRVNAMIKYTDHPQTTVRGKSVDVVVTVGNDQSKTTTGIVGFADVTIDQQNGLYRAWVEIENPQDASGHWLFTPGMSAKIYLK